MTLVNNYDKVKIANLRFLSNGCGQSIVICVFLIPMYVIQGENFDFICCTLSKVGFFQIFYFRITFFPDFLFGWEINAIYCSICVHIANTSVADIWKHALVKRLLPNFASVKLATITKEFAPVPFKWHIIIMNRL